MRVIVVGGGIMGLCTAWALRRAGHEPALFEQGPLPNPLASSTDQHRLIRFTYGAMTGYARMVHEAYGAWRRLFADLGRSHYRPTGTLAVAREEDGWVAELARCLEDLGVALERWSAADLAAACRSSTSRAPATRCSRRAAARCSRSASCATSSATSARAGSRCTSTRRCARSIRPAR